MPVHAQRRYQLHLSRMGHATAPRRRLLHRESRAGGWSGGRHRGQIVLGQAGRVPAMDRVHASLLDRLGKARRSGADLARPTYVPMRPRRSVQNGCHASRCGLAFSSMSTSHAILGCLQRTCTSGQTHIRPNGDSLLARALAHPSNQLASSQGGWRHCSARRFQALSWGTTVQAVACRPLWTSADVN